METQLHMTCTGYPEERVVEAVRRAKELGVCNILALRGSCVWHLFLSPSSLAHFMPSLLSYCDAGCLAVGWVEELPSFSLSLYIYICVCECV